MSAPFITVERAPFSISTDPALLDLPMITEYLAHSYWAEGIPLDVVERAVQGSLCFGIYEGAKQVGFARCVTDAATFAYLADVFVIESHRGRGLSRWLMEVIVSHPDLQGLRRFSLVTRDAHGLYEKFGFTPLSKPEGHMEIVRRGIYLEKRS
ncbi:MAG TPA: GNAT family N-acetyltransferase [Candidatus Krumholzibacteria bacterium]|nr:GNAT family N-acetyltransferase [Candidatus Krumholzibacteria bacterium]